MATINRKTRSGNRIVVFFDGGKQVGLIRSIRSSDDYAPEPASGIGDIHVQEYVPTQARHTLAVSHMVLDVDSLREIGINTLNGDDALEGRVFDIAFVSKDTGDILRKYFGCSFASGDVEVNAHQIVVTNAQFNALDVQGAKL
jgi:hypothetical protein